ncbi:MAG: 16S rRNA (cytosine(1402)-N(4))-methyltransferase RsmH [bacterium]|nr:16S rRNA (cytosine(1402)-N(4))-methyltransferase RsmH [bacterium]
MHIPVLLKEVIDYLDPKANKNFIDCTLGEGGHALAILEKNGPKGKVLGIERDSEIFKNTKYNPSTSSGLSRAESRDKILNTRYKNRLITVCDNFVNLKKIVNEQKFNEVSGILFDLGLSSWHLQECGRGFSFSKDEPLNMRLDGQQFKNELTAYQIVNCWSEEEIERTLRQYGGEKFAKRIAERICLARKAKPIESTKQLAEIVKKAVPPNYEKGRINPATRTFLALRIVVNQELENLEETLPQTLDVLEKNGKVLVISFNSLEDRLVKNFFRTKEKQGLIKILTKKPVVAGGKELEENPRSRSASLRAAKKL